jgi:integrase
MLVSAPPEEPGKGAQRIRDRYELLFPHVHPHATRHTFAMATSLERLVRGYYQQAAQLAVDAGGDDALALST